MRIAIDDLGLKRLWAVYPGPHRFPTDPQITAWPLRDVGLLVTEIDAA